MNISQLPKIVSKGKRRLGQGHGSGRVKTGGRGQKGQKARHSIPLAFEGGALPLIKRLPLLRGHGKNPSYKRKPLLITVGQLNTMKADTVIDEALLIKHHVVAGKEVKKRGVKVVANGDVSIPLTIQLPVSKNAQAKIEKVGGKVETSNV